MRAAAGCVLALAGCGFAAGSDDPPRDAPGPVDAAVPDAGDCTTWLTGLDSDPLASGAFRMRSGGALGGRLDNGVWEAFPATDQLDTTPKHDFAGITDVEVRMRGLGDVAPGAVFAINVGFGGGTYTPVWLHVSRQLNATQAVKLYSRTRFGTAIELLDAVGLPDGMVDIALRIDAPGATIAMTAASVTRSAELMAMPVAGNDDRFATLAAEGSTAQFDRLRVRACPP